MEENIGQVFHMIEALKEPHCQIFFIHPEVQYRTEPDSGAKESWKSK